MEEPTVVQAAKQIKSESCEPHWRAQIIRQLSLLLEQEFCQVIERRTKLRAISSDMLSSKRIRESGNRVMKPRMS